MRPFASPSDDDVSHLGFDERRGAIYQYFMPKDPHQEVESKGRRVDFRSLGLALSLFALVFATVIYCLSFPVGLHGVSTLWIVNGLPLAALLRTPMRHWPVLILAGILGNMAGDIYVLHAQVLTEAIRAGTNAIQYGLCAYVLRRRFGAYFDITDLGQMLWLAGMYALTGGVRSATMLPLLAVFDPGNAVHDTLLGYALAILKQIVGMAVLSLPLIAITSRRSFDEDRFDLIDVALLALLVCMVALVFGLGGIPAALCVTPILMMLAWRRGPFGAGVGVLIAIIQVGFLSRLNGGFESALARFGYDASERGIYLELYFTLALLTSLPMAMAHTRQLRDAAARKAAEAALGEVRAELTRVARVSALGAFSASLAHEINQPLAALVTNS